MYPVITLGPSLQIPTFYLVLSLVVCLCLFWLARRAQAQNFDRKLTLDGALIVMVASLVGSRLFHVFYENPEVYRADPMAVFYLWNGGFVFYGGAMLAGLCGFVFIRIKAPRDWPTYFDLFAPVCSLAYALGRWGCFFAGCCYGKYCDLPWAIDGRHPTQLYASFWELGVLCLLLAFEKKKNRRPGHVFLLWIVLHCVGRLLMESERADFRGANTWGLSVSSWVSLVLILVAGSDLLAPYFKKNLGEFISTLLASIVWSSAFNTHLKMRRYLGDAIWCCVEALVSTIPAYSNTAFLSDSRIWHTSCNSYLMYGSIHVSTGP